MTTHPLPAHAGHLRNQQIVALQQQLLARETELQAQVHAINEEKQEAPGSVPTSHVDDLGALGEQRTREAIRHAEQERDIDELRAIATAMARIDDGQYGLCVDCGEEIALARLRAQPAALRCVPCQQRYEGSHRAVPRVDLPPLA
jgi:RNA polymerase-binding protein DksA